MAFQTKMRYFVYRKWYSRMFVWSDGGREVGAGCLAVISFDVVSGVEQRLL